MCECVRQSGIAVSASRRGNPVQRGLHRAITQGVYVNDQALFVGGNTQLGELFGIKQQIAVAPGVRVRFAEIGSL